MQHHMGEARESRQRGGNIEVSRDRLDAPRPEQAVAFGILRQAQQTVAAGQERCGSQRHIPAADDQQASHIYRR